MRVEKPVPVRPVVVYHHRWVCEKVFEANAGREKEDDSNATLYHATGICIDLTLSS